MKVKALQSFVCGRIDASKGEIFPVSERTAKKLVSKKLVEACEEAEAPAEQSQEAEAPAEQPATASKKATKTKSGSK